jgi:DNA-directed RNA polymerase specialized sigma24 family protein
MAIDLNVLYDVWANNPTPDHLGDLLEGVRNTVVHRYQRQYSDAEDISQLVMVKVWRSLPGYDGPDPLKPYSPARGKFNPFVSVIARTMVIDCHKYDRLIATEDRELEYLSMGIKQQRPQMDWDSDERTEVLPKRLGPGKCLPTRSAYRVAGCLTSRRYVANK